MRFLLLAALLAPALLAQNFTGQIKLKSLVPPISQPWNARTQAQSLEMVKPSGGNSGTCSIPLLVVSPKDVDPQMTITPPASGYSMRVVTPAASPCSKMQQ